MKVIKVFVLFISISLILFSCKENYTPKPRGYFRIDLPEKSYVKFDSTFPYSFEFPAYATITNDPYSPEKKYWLNINYKPFKAVLHISYQKVDNNLPTLINDSYNLVSKHISKADAIYDSVIFHPDRNVYGLVYDIEGIGVASQYQFFLTDSTDNYLRGALYFNESPNNDSLQPVIKFLKEDINFLITTFRWKNK
jgi:gliding motility-associated lipoprotein GldD